MSLLLWQRCAACKQHGTARVGHQTGHKPGKIADMDRSTGSVWDLLALSLHGAPGSSCPVNPAATAHAQTHTHKHTHDMQFRQNDSLPVTPRLWPVSCLMSQDVLIPQVSKSGGRQRHLERRMGIKFRQAVLAFPSLFTLLSLTVPHKARPNTDSFVWKSFCFNACPHNLYFVNPLKPITS